MTIAASTLAEHGHAVERGSGWLLHADSGFTIVPQIVAVEPLPDGGVRTATTIQVNHPTLVPDGVFEYQHAAGDGLAEAIGWGFSQWVQLDFVVLLDAMRQSPKSCAIMEMQFPEKDGAAARTRRVLLGPVAELRPSSPVEAPGDGGEAHSFCPCCLFTNTFEAFRSLIDGDEVYCLRLFAKRDEDGTPGADCRINGEDYEPGAEALRAYARTWRSAGLEFHKQLVILQTAAPR